MRSWRRMGNSQRLLIIGGGAALAIWLAWVAWPHVKSATVSISHQLSRSLVDIARALDLSDPRSRYDDGLRRRSRPRGEDDYGEDPLSRGDAVTPAGEGDYAEPPRRQLRFPSGAGDGAGYDRTSTAGGVPRDRQGRPYRHWRYCLDSPGHAQQCGPWQSGPAREGN
jgi:hypothetical protein